MAKEIGSIGTRRARRTILRPSSLKTIPLGAALIMATLVFLGIFGPLITPLDPAKGSIKERLQPPVWAQGGSLKHILGTDQQGRDVLSRLIGGTRISLIVGLSAVTLAGTIGIIMALLSGYLGGWVDIVISRVIDALLSMPFLLVAIAVAGALGPGLRNIILVLVFTGWAGYARILRSEVLRLKEADFIRLAKTAGCSTTRIMLHHILPNIANTFIVLGTLQLGSTIIATASLSFLGLGVPPPSPDWGLMLADGRQYITSAWWLCLFPGLAIALTVLATNLLGDWLRIRLDPKFRQL